MADFQTETGSTTTLSQPNHLGWLLKYCSAAIAIEGVFTDDFDTIRRRIIDPNENVLKGGVNANWFMKKIVTNFVQTLNKFVENLTELRDELVEESNKYEPRFLEERFVQPSLAGTTNTNAICSSNVITASTPDKVEKSELVSSTYEDEADETTPVSNHLSTEKCGSKNDASVCNIEIYGSQPDIGINGVEEDSNLLQISDKKTKSNLNSIHETRIPDEDNTMFNKSISEQLSEIINQDIAALPNREILQSRHINGDHAVESNEAVNGNTTLEPSKIGAPDDESTNNIANAIKSDTNTILVSKHTNLSWESNHVVDDEIPGPSRLAYMSKTRLAKAKKRVFERPPPMIDSSDSDYEPLAKSVKSSVIRAKIQTKAGRRTNSKRKKLSFKRETKHSRSHDEIITDYWKSHDYNNDAKINAPLLVKIQRCTILPK